MQARQRGVNLERVLTIGRQGMHLSAAELVAETEAYGLGLSEGEAGELLRAADGYAEPFLKRIGAGQVDSMDIAPYEGATLLHDMNLPIPESWYERWTLVLDGGSLEHVFHYPVALRNCMQMVAAGGDFVSITPANNLLGHGFYQISPELFFRVFQPENGYLCQEVIVYENPFSGHWHEVIDPEQVRTRVELINTRETYLIARGRRQDIKEIFALTPQQSDYSALWTENEGKQIDVAATRSKEVAWWRQLVPAELIRLYRLWKPYRGRFYRRVDF